MAIIMFDAEDFEPAIAELDARYLAGEAARTRARGRRLHEPTPRSIVVSSQRRHQIG